MTMPVALTPPRPRFFTPGVWLVTAIAVLGGAVLLYRFMFGLDSTTNLKR